MIATPQLTVAQLRTREACEEDTRNGIDSIKTHMKRVGQALQVIRDDRLYLSTHGSFEAYVDDVWKLSRARAYQLIGHASVIANLSRCEMLSTIVDTLPEAATRELSGLGPEDQCEVVLKASNNGKVKPTALRIAETVIETQSPQVSTSSDALCESEQSLLAECEATIGRGMQMEGQARRTIQEDQPDPFKQMIQRRLQEENPLQVANDAMELLRGISRNHPLRDSAWMAVRRFIDANIESSVS